MELHEEIMSVLKKHALKTNHTYVNPHFLTAILDSLEMYYGLEDELVYDWISDMYYR